ncbi:claudin-1-like isoform X2 [Thunnus maccoyii]|nr:claudin-1-like isoform X2 [Thunnus maccoyii]
MTVGLQVVGLVLGVVSWCLQSSCTSSQMWKVRSQVESVTSSQWQFEGLWMSCAATSLGSLQCSKFKTVLGLPAHLQVCRALMILSLLVGLASIIVSVLGLKCTKIGRTSEHTKDQIALSGGILFILSGLFTLTAVSWYAARVIHDFYDPLNGGVRSVPRTNMMMMMMMMMVKVMMVMMMVVVWFSFCRFELGTGLYLGWGASCLAILGGSMLCCSCRRSSPAPPARQFSYNYSSSRGQSIYRAAPASDNSSSKAYV